MLKIAIWIVAGGAVVAPAQGGGVSGMVRYSGKAPAAIKVHMEAVDYCAKVDPNKTFFPIQVGANGGLANVFVYIKKGLEGKSFAPPSDPVVILDQKGCWYAPRIFGIMVGQKLRVVNSDDTLHNVNAQPYFNIPTAGHDASEKIFDKPKVMLRIRCNIHFWMSGYVGIVDNPYYAVSDDAGAFAIPSLPAGHYTLALWHEKLGEQTQEITVTDAGANVSATFSPKR